MWTPSFFYNRILNFQFVLSVMGLFFLWPNEVCGQRKEIRTAEYALESEEFYQAKKILETIVEEEISNKNLKARYYRALGLVYTGLYTDDYGDYEGVQKAYAYFEKLKQLGKSRAGDEGIENTKRTLIIKAMDNQHNEEYKNAYDKYLILSKLHPEDTLYLFSAGFNAFHDKELQEEAARIFEELHTTGYKGKDSVYLATSVFSNEEIQFAEKKIRDGYVASGYFTNPKDRPTESAQGQIIQLLALLYLENEGRDKAEAFIRKIEKDYPSDWNVRRNLLPVYHALEQKDKYVSELKHLVQNDPQNQTTYYFYLGNQAVEDRQFDQASAYFDKIIELEPENSIGYALNAQLILNIEAELTEQLEGTAPETPAYTELLTKRNALLKEALVYLQEIIERDKDNIAALRSIYQIYWKLEDQEKTKKYGRIIRQKTKSD